MTAILDLVNFGSAESGYKRVCSRCFNPKPAEESGQADFEDAKFPPIRIADSLRKFHKFHFRTNFFGPGVALNAFEFRKGRPAGYEFQVIGEPEDDLKGLYAELVAKIRRALSIQHVVQGEMGSQIADHRVVRGRIGWDPAQNGRVPALVIDGREIYWEEFGRMLMTYEGWQFKLSIFDRSEEV